MTSLSISTTTTTTTPFSFSLLYFFDKQYYFPNTTNYIQLNLPKLNIIKSNKKSVGSKSGSISNILFVVSSCLTEYHKPLGSTYNNKKQRVSDKIRVLVSEFKSLKEPIDRVKRLLYYAEMLAPFDESARLPENRVKGCTTQVWLDAKMDINGKVRFRADSDSEISKGFCSCLIWVMDGADPEEIFGVTVEELEDLNIGEHGKVKSRVSTWQNVLISMRDRTSALAATESHVKLKRQLRPSPFSPLLLSSDGILTTIFEVVFWFPCLWWFQICVIGIRDYTLFC